MTAFEYRVVPAPKRGIKVNGAKTTEDRFAQALQATMNAMGAEGWEFVRSDTLPCEERQGLTGKATTYQTMLVFCRRGEAVLAEVPRIDVPAPLALTSPVLRATDDVPHQVPPLGPADGRVAAE